MTQAKKRHPLSALTAIIRRDRQVSPGFCPLKLSTREFGACRHNNVITFHTELSAYAMVKCISSVSDGFLQFCAAIERTYILFMCSQPEDNRQMIFGIFREHC